MNMIKLFDLKESIDEIINNVKNNNLGPYSPRAIKQLRKQIENVACEMEEGSNVFLSLFEVHEKLFINNMINLYQLGRLQVIISDILFEKYELSNIFWSIINERIRNLCESKFKDGYYADAVETALKEINTVLKNLFRQQNKTGEKVPDGADLMNRIFSVNNPILEFGDISNDSGRDIQIGYMQIFAGSMTGIRNPKAHENIAITKEDSIHKIFLASLLMNKIEQAVKYTNSKSSIKGC